MRGTNVSITPKRPLPGILMLALLLGWAAPARAHDREEYVVQPGDTLSVIAAQVRASLQTLITLNSIADPNRIVTGQRLRLPGGGPAPAGAGGGPAAGAASHVVAAGETLGGIARRYGVSVEALAAANGIEDVNVVWVGSSLVVAAEAPALEKPAAARVHTVAPGETLSEIAAQYGVSVQALAQANGITDPNLVIAGTSLSVPGGWQCPTPDLTRFVNDFGVPKHDGRFHLGVDLFAPRGGPVVAPVAGVVRQLNGTRGGLQFVLDGDDGTRYIGTHMDTAGPSGRVTPGTRLGTVGDTGNARGSEPHLHFEMQPGAAGLPDGAGISVNPYPVLAVACGG